MNAIVPVLLGNLVVAGFLALLAALVGRWGNRPALAHGLWLLVLLKLVTPPLWEYPFVLAEPEPVKGAPAPAVPVEDIAAPPAVVELPAAEAEPAPVVVVQPEVVPAAEPAVPRIPPISWWPALWIAGSGAWLGLVLVRLRRFQGLLREVAPAPAEVQALADDLARRLGVRPLPVGIIAGRVSPLLWTAGRPRLLLPRALVETLPADGLATLLAHELAHWRRRDHLVRWFELVVLAGYWWCPLVWWACRELRQAEEECCDAWVVKLLPDSARAYALALVETITFLSGARSPLPSAASGAGQVRLLKRRLTMILKGQTPHSLTVSSVLGLAALAAVLLPLLPTSAQAPDPNVLRDQARERADRAIERAMEFLRAQQWTQDEKTFEHTQKALDKLSQILAAQAQRPGGGDPKGEAEKAREALRRAQEDLNKALEEQQKQINAKHEELRRALERLAQAEAQKAPKAVPQNWKVITTQPNLEKRLDAIDRKLDQLLAEVKALRERRGGQGAQLVPEAPPTLVPPVAPNTPRPPRLPGPPTAPTVPLNDNAAP